MLVERPDDSAEDRDIELMDKHAEDSRSLPSREESAPREIDALDLIEAIRSVAAEGRTGTLTVTGPEGREKQLYFQDGLIKMVSSSSPEEDTLENALLGGRSFSREDVDEARREAGESGKTLAQVLLEHGAARGVDAAGLLDSATREETARIVGWPRVSCRFLDGAPLPSGSEPYASRISGGIDPEEILDVLRRAAKSRH
jgi:hypothetical protein